MIQYERKVDKKVKSKTGWNVKAWFLALAFILMTIIVFVFEFLILSKTSVISDGNYGYVTGESAKYCYVEGCSNPNIKHIQRFDTLEACGKPLYQGQC